FSTLLPLSPSTQNRSPQRGGAAGVRATVCENIDYGILCERFPDDRHYLDRIVSLVTDLLRSQKPTLRVNQEDLPAEEVKERLWQLRCEHVEYALLVLAEAKTIGNMRGFLPTVLYNATSPGTLETYYDNRVKRDLEQEWETANAAYAI
ncbi:DUF6017 domain-containing protein, partial [Ethanoligenens sp.]|uniref:DUF6017 domain-containing protein n=1 Tax=Ethanoligenens sp. TaxID=2099655 RepID=UPI0039EB8783